VVEIAAAVELSLEIVFTIYMMTDTYGAAVVVQRDGGAESIMTSLLFAKGAAVGQIFHWAPRLHRHTVLCVMTEFETL
jgi:hypothetical protein